MTIVVTWMSQEREFPTLWTVADSRLSQAEERPLFDCGAKLFSLRITCLTPNAECIDNEVYFTTTIGMAFSGSSLLVTSLYTFLSFTLGNLSNANRIPPSMQDIADHAKAVLHSMLENYNDINMQTTRCEVSIFGFCPIYKKHRLFHIKHTGEDLNIIFEEFSFLNEKSMHLMGNHCQEIYKLILSERESKKLRPPDFWRSPKGTIENIIKHGTYPDIGGKLQLGIGYPGGFKLTPIYHQNSLDRYLPDQKPHLLFQGLDLYSKFFLTHVGECCVDTDSVLSEKQSVENTE